ncbi:hypothetical protein TNCV_895161 [Trichonephila clavipes]|nr:hypothetical protein TNCV_895161 [Trichonephila clavipes]
MGREDVLQSTKRSNEAEHRRGEGKNAGRKAGRPKAVDQDVLTYIVLEIDGVAIYRVEIQPVYQALAILSFLPFGEDTPTTTDILS